MRAQIPPGKVLIPGALDTTTNFIGHPELIAQRLQRFVDVVGAERVIAGSDCGFGTFAGFGAVDEDIVYAKLASMAEGAARVTGATAAVAGGVDLDDRVDFRVWAANARTRPAHGGRAASRARPRSHRQAGIRSRSSR